MLVEGIAYLRYRPSYPLFDFQIVNSFNSQGMMSTEVPSINSSTEQVRSKSLYYYNRTQQTPRPCVNKAFMSCAALSGVTLTDLDLARTQVGLTSEFLRIELKVSCFYSSIL